MRTMAQKREALAEVVQIALQAIDPAYKIVQRIRLATIRADDMQQLKKVMGPDLKYCEIVYTARGTDRQNSLDRSGLVTHTFRVNIWMKFDDNDTYEQSSQYAFDALTEGDEGLLVNLDQYGAIRNDDPTIEPLFLSRPRGVTADLVPFETRGNDTSWAHYMTFEIDVLDTRAEKMPVINNQTPQVENTPDVPLPGFEIVGTEGTAGQTIQGEADGATFTEGTETITVDGEEFTIQTVTVPVL